MKRIGLAAVVVAAFLGVRGDCARCYYERIGNSAGNFQRYFRALEQSDLGIGPLERFVFSLMLANTKAPEQGKPAPAGRRS